MQIPKSKGIAVWQFFHLAKSQGGGGQWRLGANENIILTRLTSYFAILQTFFSVF